MKIIERIKSIMDAKDIKQIELATTLKLGKSTINAWFNNNSDPKAEQLEQIADLLNVSIEYLVTGKETKQHFTSEEIHLVEQFRKILPEGQKNIQRYIEFELFKQ